VVRAGHARVLAIRREIACHREGRVIRARATFPIVVRSKSVSWLCSSQETTIVQLAKRTRARRRLVRMSGELAEPIHR